MTAMLRRLVGLLAENARGIVCLVGGVWLYHGIAGFSPAAADVVAGLLLIAVGAYPYLRAQRTK